MFAGLDVSRVTTLVPPDLSPAFLDRLRVEVKGRLLIKGVVTEEDAVLAVEHGADAIIVSNHGGRNEDSLRATAAFAGARTFSKHWRSAQPPSDWVARRPGALAAFGRSGVEAVIDILNRELSAIMRQAGTPTIADIRSSLVVRSPYG